jgi:serine/threonine-protein kinase
MAEVYEAQNTETGEPAAIKLLHQNLLVQPKAVTRFLREAVAASALDTPHVARILGSSDPLDTLPYLAMERLHGNDLAHYLRHKPVMSMKRLLELVEQVGKVIDLANEAGIVHRDLKPQNIYLAEQESARPIWKVLDFGVSLLGEGSGTLTQGNIVGTPSYMAPEQARGGKVDQRTDIHALAAISYRCLTGRPPFTGNDIPSIMYSAVHSMPEAPSVMTDVPKEIDSVLAIGLAKRAEDRFESAADFSFRLQRAAKGELDPRLQDHADALLAKLPWGAEEDD